MTDRLVWTFDSVPFYPTGDDARPEGEREGRVEVFNLVGTGRAEFQVYGFNEYVLEMSVLVLSDEHATSLRTKHLTAATLVGEGTNQAGAILTNITLKKKREDFYEGSLTFKWSAAT